MLQEVLSHGSLALMFVVLLAGGFGVPFPEDIVLLTAGALSHRGVIRWEAALAVCASGVIAGDLILFSTAKRLGSAAVDRPMFRRLLTEKRRARITALFAKHGGKVVLFARNVAGLRAPTFVLAGMDGMPAARFLFWDALGLCVSAPLSFGLGYVFSNQLDEIRAGIVHVEHVVVLALVSAIVAHALAVVVRRAWAARESRRRTTKR